MTQLTALIDDLVEGRWISPLTGQRFPPAPVDRIVIAENLVGCEADLVASLGFQGPFAVVSDQNTHPALGGQVAAALARLGPVEEIVLDTPHCDMATVDALAERTQGAAQVIAVGSGTINDLCKYVTHRDGRPYCVFATAASMNGYTSSTASVTLDSGLKVSLPAQVPRGVFIDLSVLAAAPAFLAAAGFGDSLCRTVAQIDWWMSHRLFGTKFRYEPFVIQIPDERLMLDRAAGLPDGDLHAIGALVRVLILCGLGVGFTGMSNHGSMGEHQISHYIDCFAGARHPGTLHGQQVGVASLTMARVQGHFLASETAPQLVPTEIDPDGMAARMGPKIAKDCLTELRKKALDPGATARVNSRLAEIWPDLREECAAIHMPPEQLQAYLDRAGAPSSAAALGLDADVFREAVMHGHEMRNRYSFADIAASTGTLAQFAVHGA